MSGETHDTTTEGARHTSGTHWKFFRAGGFDQVRLDSGKAVAALGRLDQKLWAALSCPTRGIEMDTRSLDILDGDKDGRVRAGDVISAVEWACRLLKDPDVLLKREASLPLAAIDDTHDEGRAVLAAARRILAKSGKPDAEVIGLAEVAGVEEVFAANDFNGDGVVPAEIVDDAGLRAVIEDIIAALGGETDRGGLPGVTLDKVEAFFSEAEAVAAWAAREESEAELRPLDKDSAAAAEALAAVAAKVEDWFTRSALAAFDPRAARPLNRSEEDWAALSDRLLSPTEECLAVFPLAAVRGDDSLPLGAGLNPAWADAMAAFSAQVVVPLLGERSHLSVEEWKTVKARFAPRAAWESLRPQGPVSVLGPARLAEILASGAKAAILDLIDKDLALAAEAEAIASVDRLLRYCRDLMVLLNNFVAFRDFYTHRHKAVFQVGTLFLDGRSCDLCVRVEDPAKHAAIATLSRIYLLYCECVRRGGDGEERMFIAAAVTNGDSDQLIVGRNGVFYDRKGGDWDATVVRILEHPISIRQSFWAPYKQAGKMIAQQAEKFAAAKAAEPAAPGTVAKPPEPASAARPAAPAPAAGHAAPAPAPAAAPFDVGRFAGIFAALGLAVGAIGTAVASVVTGFLALPWWQIPLALAGILLLVSGPSMLIAAFKLHQRNLGPILDANGWAVNTHARINIPFGTALTHLARLPEGAQRSMKDPYAEKELPWRSGLAAAAVVALGLALWKLGVIANLIAAFHK